MTFDFASIESAFSKQNKQLDKSEQSTDTASNFHAELRQSAAWSNPQMNKNVNDSAK